MKKNVHINDWFDVARKVDPCVPLQQLETMLVTSGAIATNIAADAILKKSGLTALLTKKTIIMISIFTIGTAAIIALNVASNDTKTGNKQIMTPPVMYDSIYEEDISNSTIHEEESYDLIEEIFEDGAHKNIVITEVKVTLEDTIKQKKQLSPPLPPFPDTKVISPKVPPNANRDFKTYKRSLKTNTDDKIKTSPTIFTITQITQNLDLETFKKVMAVKNIDFVIKKIKRKKGKIKDIKIVMSVKKGIKSNCNSTKSMSYNSKNGIKNIEIGWEEDNDGIIDELILNIEGQDLPDTPNLPDTPQ